MEKWNIVEVDGNPTERGVYDVILIWPHPKTMELRAEMSESYFGDATTQARWIKDGQPERGLVWTNNSGDMPGNRVYAWLPKRKIPRVELPEGVTWDAEIDAVSYGCGPRVRAMLQERYCDRVEVPMFAPMDGRCVRCGSNIWDYILEETAGSTLVTACPVCGGSFVE